MLVELAVRNLGVIEELSLVLGDGMTAVTGETGAGKTLVVGAIELLTGGRATASLVYPGTREAEIEGRFVTSDGDETVIRRVVPRSGRSRSYMNGRLATVASLKELRGRLVDLHGQHAHQSLLRTSVQRAALDTFGDVDTSRLEAATSDLKSLRSRLKALGGDARERAREIDLLRYQVSEIEAAGITDQGEDERLDRTEELLAQASEHRESAQGAATLLGTDGMVSDGLGQALALITNTAPFDDSADRLSAAIEELTDIAATLRQQSEMFDEDPAALAAVRERRAELASLKRKYGSSLSDVVEFAEQAQQRLSELEGYEELAESLEQQRIRTKDRLVRERSAVSAARAHAAPKLAAAVESHLRTLAMKQARFDVALSGPAGEQVSFGLAANPGHTPQPLGRVASGGELARTMLALRLVLTAGPPTLVFDEVDAGIGGTAAHAVGKSLADLANEHQVLCVTHLAQVAAHAHSHFVVERDQHDPRRSATIRGVTGDDRLAELSRMLSGSPESDLARQHADELLNAARAAQAI